MCQFSRIPGLFASFSVVQGSPSFSLFLSWPFKCGKMKNGLEKSMKMLHPKYCTNRYYRAKLIILFLLSNCPICNSNWTEWSTIQGVIGRVISNRPSA